MQLPLQPRNAPRNSSTYAPATPISRSASAQSHYRPQRSRIEAAAWLLGLAAGIVMVGIAIWGLWVSADVVRYAGFASVGPAQHRLSAAVFLLSWLVLFAPFFYFGIALLRSTFTPEKRAWLVSLRVFTYIVGLRAAAEAQRRKVLNSRAGADQISPQLSERVPNLLPDSPPDREPR